MHILQFLAKESFDFPDYTRANKSALQTIPFLRKTGLSQLFPALRATLLEHL